VAISQRRLRGQAKRAHRRNDTEGLGSNRQGMTSFEKSLRS
jgi:hypothetical protein